MTDGADVTKPPGCAGAAPAQYADTIQSNGFWSRTWSGRRRDGDGPRSLEQLLKQVEKGTQVRSSGHERILEELKSHRDSAEGADLKSALTWLCNAQTRLGSDPTTAHSREVKRVLATAGPTRR